MPRKLSAGLLLYRRANTHESSDESQSEGADQSQSEGADESHSEGADAELGFEVLLGHPGGPFWARKDDGAWSIPKGEYESGQDPFAAAKREFEEELGSAPPAVEYRELGSVSQPGGKLVTAWAAEADFDAAGAVSNTFELQWPPGSGQLTAFPEIDRAHWFSVEVARVKLVKGQRPFIDRLQEMLGNLAPSRVPGDRGDSAYPWAGSPVVGHVDDQPTSAARAGEVEDPDG